MPTGDVEARRLAAPTFLVDQRDHVDAPVTSPIVWPSWPHYASILGSSRYPLERAMLRDHLSGPVIELDADG